MTEALPPRPGRRARPVPAARRRLKRSLPGRDGAWATETWRQYQQTGAPKLLRELLLYNKEDVFMLREIERELANA